MKRQYPADIPDPLGCACVTCRVLMEPVNFRMHWLCPKCDALIKRDNKRYRVELAGVEFQF